MAEARSIPILHESDIVTARQAGREVASEAGFGGVDLTLIATAISEITRNIVKYAGQGVLEVQPCAKPGWSGVQVTARDQGPGIPDLDKAMQDGYTTGGGLGLGLPGARRLMDEFSIRSEPGKGTEVVLVKWKRA